MKGWTESQTDTQRERQTDGGNLKGALQGCNMLKKAIFTRGSLPLMVLEVV
jgi:hypothetical protein